MRILILSALLLVFAPVAAAKPPASSGFVRLQQLNTDLAKRYQELKKAEEFAKKPLPEKLLIKWDEGAESFGSVKKLTGEVVVKAVFDNFDEFKKLHPAFVVLKKEEMIKDGLSAPLHNGGTHCSLGRV